MMERMLLGCWVAALCLVIGSADSNAKAQQNAVPSQSTGDSEIRAKEGQTVDLGNVKVTTNRGDNEALTNVVGIKGVGVVVTLKFVFATGPREASVIVFRMNPEPEKSEVTLSVGTTKLVPFMQASPVDPPFSLYRMPVVGPDGHRLWFHFPVESYSVSFLFDVPEKEIDQPKEFSAKFKIQTKDVFLLVNMGGPAAEPQKKIERK